MQRLVRVLAAALLLTGAAVHLDLWRGGYDGIRYIGPLFLVNVAASAVVAIALQVRKDSILLLAGAGVALASLVALVLSRTTGLLGFMEAGFTPQAMRTIAAEVGALVALAVIYTLDGNRRRLVPVRVRNR